MRTLFLTTAAFAALVMVAPIGKAHAQLAASHVHPDSYWTSPSYLGSDRKPATPAPVLANCYLKDSVTVYMDGPCKYQPTDRKGAFVINNGRFEAMISRDNAGLMSGAYYPVDATHLDRGTIDVLHQVGPCWVNSSQRICAGKPGQHVSPVPVSKVPKATVAMATTWLSMKAECDKAPDGVGENYPASCTAMQALGDSLTKQGCEIMGDDSGPDAYWTCGGQAFKSNL